MKEVPKKKTTIEKFKNANFYSFFKNWNARQPITALKNPQLRYQLPEDQCLPADR